MENDRELFCRFFFQLPIVFWLIAVFSLALSPSLFLRSVVLSYFFGCKKNLVTFSSFFSNFFSHLFIKWFICFHLRSDWVEYLSYIQNSYNMQPGIRRFPAIVSIPFILRLAHLVLASIFRKLISIRIQFGCFQMRHWITEKERLSFYALHIRSAVYVASSLSRIIPEFTRWIHCNLIENGILSKW